jgi:MFS family permease
MAALVLLCAAQFVVVCDVTIVAVALPTIGRDLGFSTQELQWVVSAYTLAFGGCLLAAGRAADVHGRRRLFALGLGLFALASLACALAPGPAALVGARVAQGVGAALVAPAALALLTAAFPAGRARGRALAAWTAAAAGGGASGWLLGGLITEGLGWQWVFLVNVPVGAAGVALARVLLPDGGSGDGVGGLPVAGTLLATGGLVAIVLALTRAEADGPGSPAALGSAAAGAALLACFATAERRASLPLLPRPVRRSPALLHAALVALALTATTTPPILLALLYVQDVLGARPLEAGIAFAPCNLAVIAGSAAGPRVARSLGAPGAMAAGLGGIAAGALLLLAAFDAHGGGALRLVPGLLLMGAALGVASVGSTAAGTAAVPGDGGGIASGVLNAAAQIGTAAGLAAFVSLAAARTAALGSGGPEALVEGYRWATAAAAGLAALAAVAAATARSGRAARAAT